MQTSNQAKDVRDAELHALQLRIAQLEQEVASLKRPTAPDELLAQVQLAYQEAETARQYLYGLFMQAPALIAILRGREGVVELFNPLFSQLWGQREVIGKTMRQAWPELEGQGYFEFVESVYDQGEPVFGNEYPAMIDRHNNGRLDEAFFNFIYYPYRDVSGKVAGVMMHGVEVTEQVQGRKSSEALAEQFRFLADNIPQVVWKAKANGDIEFFNQHWLNYTGLSLNDTKDWGWEQIIHPDDLEENLRVWKHSLSTGTPFEFEHRFRRFDGAYRWHLGRGLPMRDEQGNIVMWIGTNADIDDQKRLNEQKDQFLSTASHDLRTPLTSIKGYSQILQRQFAQQLAQNTDPKLESFLNKGSRSLEAVLRQTNRMSELINRLLEFSRIGAEKLELNYSYGVDLVQYVRQVVEQQTITADEHFISLDTPSTPLVTAFDEARLEQVLNNLISNAIKYSPPGTSITIGIEQSDAPQAAAIVWVRDEGVGISPEQQAHLFERFYRVPAEQAQSPDGLGLGLYISSEIIKQHGGRIWLESAAGKGSTFYFSLPHRPSSAQAIPATLP